MSSICFDILVSESDYPKLQERFEKACIGLVENGHASNATPTFTEAQVDPEVAEQLRAQAPGLSSASFKRCCISIEDLQGSLNTLTMRLSHLLTPQVELPKDPVLLFQETRYEVPATYPWTVEVRR